MSASAQKHAKTAAPEKSAQSPPKKRWKVHVNQHVVPEGQGESHISADRLRLAALQAQPLPYRQDLEAEFDADLSGISVFRGPEVDAALAASGARAVVRGDAVLLPADADKPLVAHEIAHVLQQRASGPHATTEAAEAEAREAEARVAEGCRVPDMCEGLFPGTIAFRRVEDLHEAQLIVGSDREAAQAFHEGRGEAPAPETVAPEAEPLAAESAEAETARAADTEGAGATDAVDPGEPILDEPVPTFEPAPMPEIEVDETAAEAAAAEAEEALQGAEDEAGLMGAFKDAPPSAKALHHDRIDGQVGTLAAEDQTDFEANLPEFQAKMTGTDDLAEPQPVQTPEGQEAQLEDGTPALPPEPELDPTPDPGTADLNPSGHALVSNWFTEGDAAGLGQAFNNVSTGDNEVDTSAGDRPEVPLEGATDPQRVADQDAAAREDATNRRQEATQAVLDGPGPERVELQQVREEFAIEAREAPQIEAAEGPVAGAADFREKELGGDVAALFDAHHAEGMAASLDEATTEVGSAVETRNTERDAKVAETEAEKDRLNAEADAAQREEVGQRRQDAQDARQTAVDAQARHVADVEAEADTRRDLAQSEIDTQVSTTETQVETEFAQAEEEAEDELRAGEREAEEERQRQEREAENLSWWERAANWVAEQFDRLTQFINDVFDAVRDAVKSIIDAVKEAALALIDLAASAIIAAIEALGEALKAAVNALLAEHFPAVAQALNDAIDSTVEIATEAVNAIAEGLKAAVSALLDALAAGLDAILAAYQAVVNAALVLARAALTGDWEALAKLVLEPILLALGIQPAAFYEMISRAMEALDIIIDDPIGFLSNLVESFVGGVRKFGSNLLTHLQQGIISWLTGALGGDIQIPERFDLMGVLDLARQILGLTLDMMRRVAVRVLGEEAVERIEFFVGYVADLITGGFSALWERIMADLSNLKDMVLEAIKSFLFERVIMAAITWLAGLFNPVGALVKLVMTIWNFLMFLKDQLARIFQVVQTIANAMWEIATGVLEPAMQSVENVLARLLPIAIDLLARLLGLGNVAGRVREIIVNVRQRIEDAIVNLINRVLSAFTGGRRGGASGADAAEGADSDTDLMQPIAFSGGGERHSLFIQEEGANTVPTMRSTPQPVETWLTGLRGAGLERIGAEKDPPWNAEQIAEKRREIGPLLDQALGSEAELDTLGDAENRREDAAPEGTDVTPSPALRAEGEELAGILSRILEALGLSAPPVEQIFAGQIAAMDPGVRARFTSDLLPWMQENASEIATLSWDQVVDRVVAGAMSHTRWNQPGLKPGVLRSEMGGGFLTALFTEVQTRAEARISANAETVGTARPFSGDPQLEFFFHRYLANDLNQPDIARRIQARLLGPGANIAADMIALMSTTLDAAIGRIYGTPRADWAITNGVSGANFQSVMIDAARDPTRSFGPYFEADEDNLSGGGTPTRQESLLWFLNSSRRQGRNRRAFSQAIRNASTGQHEWIPGNLARRVIEVTAEKMERAGETLTVRGAFALIRFQHEVRTPTSDLMFKPGAALPHLDRTINYLAPRHYQALLHGEEPTQDQLDSYYEGRPALDAPVGAIQAHAGGLNAIQRAGNTVTNDTRLQYASNTWHSMLEQRIQAPLADFALSDAELNLWREPIVGFFNETIWRGAVPLPAPGGVRFDLYFLTSRQAVVSYEGLRSHAQAAYQTTLERLNTDMERVLG